MKISMIVCIVSLAAATGCASHPHPYDSNTASKANEDTSAFGQPSDACINKDVPCKHDNFDTAADYSSSAANVVLHAAADGSRYIYNEASKAYDYLNSQEAKDDYKNAFGQALKDYGKDAEKELKKP